MEFKVISGDDKLIKEVLDFHNDNYGTDFKIKEFIFDEVIFCIIRVSKFEESDIFRLGYQFGEHASMMRSQGKIDW